MTPFPRSMPARSGAPFLLVLAVVAAACGGPDPSSTPDARTPDPAASAAPSRPPSGEPTSAAPSPDAASPSARTIADDPGPLALEVVSEGLASPIGFATTPGGRLVVHERDGRILDLDTASGSTRVVLDIADRVMGGNEQGLLGVAFHPEWPAVPTAFVHYTDRSGNTVVSSFDGAEVDGVPTLDPDSEVVRLTAEQPFANHNGGQLAFGPDGLLYIGLGDGGSGGDPFGNGQNSDTLLGKILRIDVAGDSGYAIPPENPYADGVAGAPEVLLTGLRNPWRFSFDTETGLLWVADVGQGTWEEVHRVDPQAEAGANLGWNVMEGAHCFSEPDCATDGLQLPIAEYGHDIGCSVTGGAVYRGSAIPTLWGWYLFSDYCGGMLFAVPADADAPADGALAPRILLEPGLSVSAFGVDGTGELYLADVESGAIYRIVGG